MGPLRPISEPAHARQYGVVALLLTAGIAAAIVNGINLAKPALFFDDFQILAQSWTWQRTWDGLWVPQNEHAMPLGRLLTYVLNLLAGRLSNLPEATALVGPLAQLLGLPLVYRFVSRELSHPLYGLLAVLLFGVTSVYAQAVYWFAASFSILALDTLLLGLLAAQDYRRTGSLLQLGLCALWCALSPAWFASGVLAGLLCCVYLWWPERAATSTVAAWTRFALVRTTPLLGTALFLAISLPRTAQAILHTPHYQATAHKDALAAFQPGKGFLLTSASLVENLLLGVVGVANVSVPWWLVAVVLPIVAVTAAWWWWRAPERRLLLLGVALIFASYLLVYSARADWFMPDDDDEPKQKINMPQWSRYHLLPQLGLMLFICGGLPALDNRRFQWESDDILMKGKTPNRLERFALFVRRQLRILLETTADGTIPRAQVRNLIVTIVLFVLIQLPHAVVVSPMWWDVAQQQADVARIEAVDACCREHRIGADAARRCLPRLKIQYSADNVNGWEFLRGSDVPLERPDEEVKEVMEKCP